MARPASGGGTVARRSDALWRDTPSAVLILGEGDDVVRLTGPGRLVWLLLADPMTPTDLERAFAEVMGEALEGDPDASRLRAQELATGVAGYLRELVDLGLVVERP